MRSMVHLLTRSRHPCITYFKYCSVNNSSLWTLSKSCIIENVHYILHRKRTNISISISTSNFVVKYKLHMALPFLFICGLSRMENQLDIYVKIIYDRQFLSIMDFIFIFYDYHSKVTHSTMRDSHIFFCFINM